jgi:hypothetical protein
MPVSGTGDATPEKRKARVRLTAREPFIESLLAGLDFDKTDIDELRAFSKQWWSSRNAWDLGRRRRGMCGTYRLQRSDADRAFSLAIAEIGGGK